MKVTRRPLKYRTRAEAEASAARAAETALARAEPSNTDEEEADTDRLRRVAKFMQTFPGIKDLDLLILKAHVLIEHELKRYLAFRLALSDDEFEKLEERTKNLGFYPLATISLAGTDHRDLLGLVCKLNDVRTEIAHRMDVSSHAKKLNELNDAVWGGPTKKPADTRFATVISLANIWGQVVQRYVDGRYGKGTFEEVMP